LGREAWEGFGLHAGEPHRRGPPMRPARPHSSLRVLFKPMSPAKPHARHRLGQRGLHPSERGRAGCSSMSATAGRREPSLPLRAEGPHPFDKDGASLSLRLCHADHFQAQPQGALCAALSVACLLGAPSSRTAQAGVCCTSGTCTPTPLAARAPG